MAFILRTFLTFLGLGAFAYLCSFLATPEFSTTPVELSEEESQAIAELRSDKIRPEDRVRINLEVDYSRGKEAAWYPRGESPLLRELVEAGELPPVAQRVGPEPVVMRGVEGVGNYGGTWVQTRNNRRNVGTFGSFYSGTHLVRWSPGGEPIVPHVAREVEVRNEGRDFIFHLRKGMRWSDGHPFTAADILYWYKQEVLDPSMPVGVRNVLRHRGKLGKVEKIDDYTVAFRFEDPNGLFLRLMGTIVGADVTSTPAHYLRKYHPTEGEPELIEKAMRDRQTPTRRALYEDIKRWDNPEHPRLWPFLFRSYKGTPPYVWVRNPYYFAVDPEGNQLPYMDRTLFLLKTNDLQPMAAAGGEVSVGGGRLEHYTLLMSQREEGGYTMRHLNSGDGSRAAIFPNLTKKRTRADPDAAQKEALMRQKEFRQALSLAINREAIIEVEFLGLTEPAQVGPGPDSAFFNEKLYRSFTDYDPQRANALLDSIGLTQRDAENYRTFPDGTGMTFNLSYITGSMVDGGMIQSIVEDWAEIGIRVLYKERGTRLYYMEREAMLHDFTLTTVTGEVFPLINPKMYVPEFGTYYAHAWGYWYARGGYYGVDLSDQPGAFAPPEDHPLMDAIDRYDAIIQMDNIDDQIEAFQEVLDIAAENLWVINISSAPPMVRAVKKGFRNYPERAYRTWKFLSPVNFGYETFYWDEPEDSEGAREQVKQAILEPLGAPSTGGSSGISGGSPSWISGSLLRGLFGGGLLFFLGWMGIRYPYVGKRLLLMIPTLIIISILVFCIIRLPPGDFSTTMMAQAEAMGEQSDLDRIEEIKELFLLEESWVEQYLRWTGLRWFWIWDREDRGLLQGDLGRSMETMEPVNEVVGDRMLLTFLISLGTILFTWLVALPVGIFSAVKQYSLADYVFTILGFLGMCIPNFLLAILLMYLSASVLGVNVSGLFSAEYAAQPEWSWGKFLDLMKHLWVPVVVVGTAGTASMIRVMRGNLLDELKKPYVVTARAKGVKPLRLILKYPVRLALNPFISGIGHSFPQLISGGAIVALILSLPTVGPLLLEALLAEDMYLAGSLLMMLSFLGVLGTLVSDLLLMSLDPRIRMEGGIR